MMTIQQLKKSESNLNQKVILEGWVRFNRSSNKFCFIDLTDGSDLDGIQLVIKSENLANFQEICLLNIFSSIKVEGILTSNIKNNTFEILVQKLEMLKKTDNNLALQKKFHSLDFLREIPHLRSKTKYFYSIFKIRSECFFQLHAFFHEKKFINVQSPILTSSDCEGAGETFKVQTSFEKESFNTYFKKQANLTVSGQLHAEVFAQTFKNVYTFGPTFRAEKSNTVKHLSEFWMLEPEMAFCSLEKAINLAWEMIQFVCAKILQNCSQEISFLQKYYESDYVYNNLKNVVNQKLKIISYSDAIKQINTNKTKFVEYLNENYSQNKDKNESLLNIEWGDDLNSEHEKFLTSIYDQPIAITNYPEKIKAFYMKQSNNQTVECFDLLVPKFGELIGGSCREDNSEVLKNKLNESTYENLKWYVEDLRNYGYFSSAGFGLGFERLIMFIANVQNIRDVIAFPRSYQSLEF